MPVALLLLPAASHADARREAFVEANLLGIFYHELGHALIDILGLPVFGQEEDAADVGLPEERADSCPEEFQLALDSWGPAFDDIAGQGATISFDSAGHDSLTAQAIGAEVAALNDDFELPVPLLVRVEVCGEANAFYDPGARHIIMCSEFEAHLRRLYSALE